MITLQQFIIRFCNLSVINVDNIYRVTQGSERATLEPSSLKWRGFDLHFGSVS